MPDPDAAPQAPGGKLGHFFDRLLGRNEAAGAYTRTVERGYYVVVVDARDDAEGERAQVLLQGMEAGDLTGATRRPAPAA